jgi:hypothetical protein
MAEDVFFPAALPPRRGSAANWRLGLKTRARRGNLFLTVSVKISAKVGTFRVETLVQTLTNPALVSLRAGRRFTPLVLDVEGPCKHFVTSAFSLAPSVKSAKLHLPLQSKTNKAPTLPRP